MRIYRLFPLFLPFLGSFEFSPAGLLRAAEIFSARAPKTFFALTRSGTATRASSGGTCPADQWPNSGQSFNIRARHVPRGILSWPLEASTSDDVKVKK